ncbi:MAG: thymidylate synthase, partial [Lachnospiraceae bacterium]|nr:thymidylate synthase [Lachnospiraceae bacterium]
MNNQIKNELDVKNRADLRMWLTSNYEDESEFYVIVKKGKPNYSIDILPYLDAVEEALCFGFIDTT